MAFQSYASFKGTKQGQLKGETRKGKTVDKWIEISSFKMPRDAASGLPTGKRTHNPIVVTKETNVSSPLLYQACINAEVFTEVVLEARFHGHTTGRVTLGGAVISKLGRAHGSTSSRSIETLETYTFTFEKISIENITGGTSTSDDWLTNNV
jgi:type VI secretion system secreted protein Hcp